MACLQITELTLAKVRMVGEDDCDTGLKPQIKKHEVIPGRHLQENRPDLYNIFTKKVVRDKVAQDNAIC